MECAIRTRGSHRVQHQQRHYQAPRRRYDSFLGLFFSLLPAVSGKPVSEGGSRPPRGYDTNNRGEVGLPSISGKVASLLCMAVRSFVQLCSGSPWPWNGWEQKRKIPHRSEAKIYDKPLSRCPPPTVSQSVSLAVCQCTGSESTVHRPLSTLVPSDQRESHSYFIPYPRFTTIPRYRDVQRNQPGVESNCSEYFFVWLRCGLMI